MPGSEIIVREFFPHDEINDLSEMKNTPSKQFQLILKDRKVFNG
jgi:hypothetical protein